MIVASLVLYFFVLFVISETIARLRPLPFAGLLVLTLAGLVGLEALVLNILSLFHAVNQIWLAGVHCAVIGCWLVWVLSSEAGRLLTHFARCCKFTKKIVTDPGYRIIFPLLLLIGLTAWLYPPNNYDSLTYHMARVAHWIENGSIAYYPTPIERQNIMGPGAEYLILFFQLLTGTDHLASFVQFFCYLAIIFSGGYLARILHLPQRLSPYIAILAATAPIAVMEASNTKNDLVAAVLVYAILIALARLFAGNIVKMRYADYALAGLALAGGFLVKATSLLVVFPLLVVSLGFQLHSLCKDREVLRKFLIGGVIAAVAFCVIAGPDIVRKSTQGASRHEVYPLFAEYDMERLWNPVRILVHNMPFPAQTRKALAALGVKGELITKDVYNLHEDMVGNPFQAAAFLLLSATTLLVGFFLPGRDKAELSSLSAQSKLMPLRYNNRKSILLALSPVAAWVFFGLIVKDQGWITRLEIPLFAILPFSFIAITTLGRQHHLIGKILFASTAIVTCVSLAYALLVAAKVPPRPIVLSHFWGEKPSREAAYYHNANLKDDHDFFLKSVEENNCQNVGLFLGPDSVDYPLTWRAMQRGIKVKHLWEQIVGTNPLVFNKLEDELNKACMLYVDTGSLEHVPRKGEQWLSAGDYHTFIRNSEWDFTHLGQTCLRIDARNGIDRLQAIHDVRIEIEPEGIALVASGNDPQMVLMGTEACHKDQAVIKLEIFSPENTELQIFFKTAKDGSYSEKSSISRKIVKGENSVYMALPSDEILAPLRIDIGKKPGKYRLASLEIRAIQNNRP